MGKGKTFVGQPVLSQIFSCIPAAVYYMGYSVTAMVCGRYISNFAAGIYIWRVIGNGGEVKTGKVVKE
jgi:hypothetical protein